MVGARGVIMNGSVGGEMNVSHASVHPVKEVPTTGGGGTKKNTNIPRVRVKDIQGMLGTTGG